MPRFQRMAQGLAARRPGVKEVSMTGVSRLMWLLALLLLALPFRTEALSPRAELTIASSYGFPGTKTVPLAVTLTSLDGAQVSGLSFDLTFDDSRLSFREASLGIAAAMAGKTATWNLVAPNRLRVIIIGVNQWAIGTGPVLSVRFNILPGAATGTSILGLSSFVASDPASSPVTRSSTDGSFRVVKGRQRVPPPPLPPRTSTRTPPPPKSY
jgi:Cohesin domain